MGSVDETSEEFYFVLRPHIIRVWESNKLPRSYEVIVFRTKIEYILLYDAEILTIAKSSLTS